MAIQFPGTYGDFQPVGFEGSAGDLSGKSCTTVVNESEAMPFGRAVAFDATGTTDRSVKLTNAAGDEIFGVTFHSHVSESFDPTLTGVAQVSTLTVAGTDTAGVYSFEVSLDGGTTWHLVTFTRVAEAAAAIATALRVAGVAVPALDDALTFLGAAADVVVTARVAGSFAIRNVTAPAPGTLTEALTTSGEPDGILQNDAGNVIRSGTVWVRPENAVTPASGVFVRITANAGVGTALGAFRGAADGGNTVDLSTVARWATSSQGGGTGALAKLMINLPHV